MTWTDKAQCKDLDTDLFFEPDRENYPTRESWQAATQAKLEVARGLCRGCPVINDCLRENLSVEFGIYGGLSTKQRVALLKRAGKYQPKTTLRTMPTPMTPERTDLILQLWRTNHSVVDIEDLTGINRGTVYRVIEDSENPQKERTKSKGYRFIKNWGDPKYARVRDMLDAGFNASHIGRETGLHYKTVRRVRYSMNKAKSERALANGNG